MDAHSHGLNNHTHSFSWSGTTGAMSKNSKGSFYSDVHTKNDGTIVTNLTTTGSISRTVASSFQSHRMPDSYTSSKPSQITLDVAHTHTYSGSGTTDKSSGDTATTTSTGKFSGTKGTTENTGGNNGVATSFSILPPYVVKYCWERTA